MRNRRFERERYFGNVGGLQVTLMPSFTEQPPQVGLAYYPGEAVVVSHESAHVAQFDLREIGTLVDILQQVLRFARGEEPA
jgi:hypothetical protein